MIGEHRIPLSQFQYLTSPPWNSIIERTFEKEDLEAGDYPSLHDVIVTSPRTTFPDIEQANDILRDSPRLIENKRGTCG